ncbi:Flp family type IVb pilin [Paludisphaera soli]|uniref:Flp family type IVb pilin n=1 Tax=Paludisphaera soli TaxID=2712865 RepID=UPI0013ED2BB9|nr:Flp family type IVb pilin [Paludisphaera soli]
MRSFMNRLVSEEDGATMVEYALMVALIAVAAIVAVTALSAGLSAKFGEVTTAL